jgi:hypothetical protein
VNRASVPGHDPNRIKEQKNKSGQPDNGKKKIIGGPTNITGDKAWLRETLWWNSRLINDKELLRKNCYLLQACFVTIPYTVLAIAMVGLWDSDSP